MLIKYNKDFKNGLCFFNQNLKCLLAPDFTNI